MHIFIAGGSGVIGRRLIPKLVTAGHTVTASTRKHENLDRLEVLGAKGITLDVLRADDVRDAVAVAAPDVIVHLFTDLSDADLAANGRLRRVGTDHLVDAAQAAGVNRIIDQSVTWVFPDGDTAASEDEPIVPGTPVHHMETRVSEMPRSTILRFGTLYGPDTWYAPGGRVAQAVMAGKIAATPAITSFIHIDDAVDALARSLDWPDGVYHIVDDEPAAGTVWLPVYARGLGAPDPRSEELRFGVTRGRAISNAKALARGWRPAFGSWREGFATM